MEGDWHRQGHPQALEAWTGQILPVLPPSVRRALAGAGPRQLESAEELRIRIGRPLMVVAGGNHWFVGSDGRWSRRPEEGLFVTPEDGARFVQLVSSASVYAVEEQVRQGYITLPGGHRVGLVGTAVLDRGNVMGLKHLSGFNIRVGRTVPGAADALLSRIFGALERPGNPAAQAGPAGRPRTGAKALRRWDPRAGPALPSLLILSPPGAGKTTLVRDLARQISNGVERLGLRGRQVAVVDERSEIAGCVSGVPRMDVGIRTDVLDGCPKAVGLTMVLRSMAPEVVVTDEVGRPEDVRALQEAANAGVAVIATAHAANLPEALRRPALRCLLEDGVFDVVAVLSRRSGPGTLEQVLFLPEEAGGAGPRPLWMGGAAGVAQSGGCADADRGLWERGHDGLGQPGPADPAAPFPDHRPRPA